MAITAIRGTGWSMLSRTTSRVASMVAEARSLSAATLEVVRDSMDQPVPRIAVIAMGRWGGRELSYASDADAMFVMDDGNGEPRGSAGSPRAVESDPTKVATAVITELRRLLAQPGVTAPIVSATSTDQLADTLKAATLKLSDEDLAELTEASAY